MRLGVFDGSNAGSLKGICWNLGLNFEPKDFMPPLLNLGVKYIGAFGGDACFFVRSVSILCIRCSMSASCLSYSSSRSSFFRGLVFPTSGFLLPCFNEKFSVKNSIPANVKLRIMSGYLGGSSETSVPPKKRNYHLLLA